MCPARDLPAKFNARRFEARIPDLMFCGRPGQRGRKISCHFRWVCSRCAWIRQAQFADAVAATYDTITPKAGDQWQYLVVPLSHDPGSIETVGSLTRQLDDVVRLRSTTWQLIEAVAAHSSIEIGSSNSLVHVNMIFLGAPVDVIELSLALQRKGFTVGMPHVQQIDSNGKRDDRQEKRKQASREGVLRTARYITKASPITIRSRKPRPNARTSDPPPRHKGATEHLLAARAEIAASNRNLVMKHGAARGLARKKRLQVLTEVFRATHVDDMTGEAEIRSVNVVPLRDGDDLSTPMKVFAVAASETLRKAAAGHRVDNTSLMPAVDFMSTAAGSLLAGYRGGAQDNRLQLCRYAARILDLELARIEPDGYTPIWGCDRGLGIEVDTPDARPHEANWWNARVVFALVDGSPDMPDADSMLRCTADILAVVAERFGVSDPEQIIELVSVLFLLGEGRGVYGPPVKSLGSGKYPVPDVYGQVSCGAAISRRTMRCLLIPALERVTEMSLVAVDATRRAIIYAPPEINVAGRISRASEIAHEAHAF